MGFTRFGMYMIVFHCKAVGGELKGHPLETLDVGWFAEDDAAANTAGFAGGARRPWPPSAART